MLRAKLLAPLGAPLQLKAGEMLPPVQPKPLKTCSLAIVAPSLTSALVKVMFCAMATLEPSTLRPNAVIQTTNFVMLLLPHDMPGFSVVPVRAQVITSVGMAWKPKRIGDIDRPASSGPMTSPISECTPCRRRREELPLIPHSNQLFANPHRMPFDGLAQRSPFPVPIAGE